MADGGQGPVKYRLFYVAGDPDGAKARMELRKVGITVTVCVMDDNARARLGQDFGIDEFPALVSDRACFTGLAAIRYFIERKTKGKAPSTERKRTDVN